MNIELKQVLASNIMMLRHYYNFSQEQLADVCGLHRTQIGNIERGEKDVVLSTLERLSAGLSISAPDLLKTGLRLADLPRDNQFHYYQLCPK